MLFRTSNNSASHLLLCQRKHCPCSDSTIYDCCDSIQSSFPSFAGFEPFSVRQLLQFDLLDKLERIQTLSAAASKEHSLEKALIKMKADWEGLAFRVVEYKDTGTYVVGGTDEVQVCIIEWSGKVACPSRYHIVRPLGICAVQSGMACFS